VAFLPSEKRLESEVTSAEEVGPFSFSVRGKQWEGELQGPTRGPPYEKKKG
jgi:hypothetical protein